MLQQRGRWFAVLQGFCCVGTLATFWALYYWPICLAMVLIYSVYLSVPFFAHPGVLLHRVFQLRALQVAVVVLSVAMGVTAIVLVVAADGSAGFVVAQIIAIVVAVGSVFAAFVVWVTIRQVVEVPAGAVRAMSFAPTYIPSDVYEIPSGGGPVYPSGIGLGSIGAQRQPFQIHSWEPRVAVQYPATTFPSVQRNTQLQRYDRGSYQPQLQQLHDPQVTSHRWQSVPSDGPSPTAYLSSPAPLQPSQSFGPQSSIFAERRHSPW